MKILIVSDTHGREENLEKVLEKEGAIDRLIHLGDVEGSEDYIRMITGATPVSMVAGNCDYWSDLPREALVELGDHLAFITHGHYYGVNGGVEQLRARAVEAGADIAMYGHTHRPYLEQEDDMTILNPGSLSLPRQQGRKPSYMVMELEDGQEEQVRCRICYLN